MLIQKVAVHYFKKTSNKKSKDLTSLTEHYETASSFNIMDLLDRIKFFEVVSNVQKFTQSSVLYSRSMHGQKHVYVL